MRGPGVSNRRGEAIGEWVTAGGQWLADSGQEVKRAVSREPSAQGGQREAAGERLPRPWKQTVVVPHSPSFPFPHSASPLASPSGPLRTMRTVQESGTPDEMYRSYWFRNP